MLSRMVRSDAVLDPWLMDFAADYNLFENLIPADGDIEAAKKRSKLSNLWKKIQRKTFSAWTTFPDHGRDAEDSPLLG
jgi:hypothetical protein